MSWDIFSKSKIQYFLQKLKDKFVQKETGKGLSTNDYTTTDKNKVSKIDTTTTSISGNPISISGLKANQLAVNPIITLEPIQAGSGTPSPSNIRAISGYDKIEVLSCGVNVWDEEWINGELNSDGTIYVTSNSICSKNFNRCSSNTNYYFKNCQNVAFYDASQTFISRSGSMNQIITTPANACYFKIDLRQVTTYANNMCVNVSNPDINGQYFPHHKTTSISESLGQTVYGGTLDVRTGVFTGTHQIIDLGDVTWTYDSTNVRFRAIGALPNASAYWTVVNWYCSCFEAASSAYADADRTYGVITLNQVSIFVRDNRYTDATAFKTAVTGQKLAYELATPLTIQLTPHEISLLKDYAYVSTNGTSIALDYHNGELASLADVAQVGETVNELGDYVGIITDNNYVDCSACSTIYSIFETIMQGQSKLKSTAYGVGNIGALQNTNLKTLLGNPGLTNYVHAYIRPIVSGTNFMKLAEVYAVSTVNTQSAIKRKYIWMSQSSASQSAWETINYMT